MTTATPADTANLAQTDRWYCFLWFPLPRVPSLSCILSSPWSGGGLTDIFTIPTHITQQQTRKTQIGHGTPRTYIIVLCPLQSVGIICIPLPKQQSTTIINKNIVKQERSQKERQCTQEGNTQGNHVH